MTTPRVCHVVPALFGADGVVGGAERYALELARHMAEHVPTRLVTFGPVAREEVVGRLQIRVIAGAWHVRGQRTNPVALALLGEIRRADVIHCHQQHVVASTLAAAVGRLTRRRVFVTDLGGGGWDLSAYVSTDRWFRGHLHISEYSRRIAGHEHWTAATVISGGVDVAKFSPDGGATRGCAALFVGRLLPHKGVDVLVEAAAADLPVDIVGLPVDPDYFATLRGLAAGKPVTFRHGCDDNELIAAYRRALCVVLPSVYVMRDGRRTVVPELLGLTLLEGMACGLPAVCTNVASMPEVVVDGQTGFVVAPNDPAALGAKLRWLRDHPDESGAMGRAARAHVLQHYTWPAVVRRCLKIYAA
jgi:glycosyltransferase involved in cell wall biosynthesis